MKMTRPEDPKSGLPTRGYNFTDLDDPLAILGSAARIGANYISYKILDKIPDICEKGTLGAFFTHYKNALGNTVYAKTYTDFGKNFPWISHRDAFRQGSTKDMQSVITVRYKWKWMKDAKGRQAEFPIHFIWKGQAEPRYADLIGVIAKMCQESKNDPRVIIDYHSKTNKAAEDILNKLYNRAWSFTGADNEYINGDFKNLEDFRPVWNDLARLDVIAAQKLGHEKKIFENNDIVITKYDKPPGSLLWLFHEFGSLFYTAKDILAYNTAGRLAESPNQIFVQDEAKEHVKDMSVSPLLGKNDRVLELYDYEVG